MGLPTTGILTMAQVVAQFGGGYPALLSRFYRGGGVVPNIPPNYGVPTSGAISMGQLRGAVSEYFVTANAVNVNIRNHVIAQGWNGVGPVYVTINPGVIVYSQTYAAALDIAGSFPDGIVILNYGTIAGRGGNGGVGATLTSTSGGAPGGAGQPGGPAIFTSVGVTINNQGSILGGGGGGGGGGSSYWTDLYGNTGAAGGSGGGGGQDIASSAYGAAGGGVSIGVTSAYNGFSGSNGTPSGGGAGGASTYVDKGQGGKGGTYGNSGYTGATGNVSSAGGAFGAAGPSVMNNNLVTWANIGDRRGPVT